MGEFKMIIKLKSDSLPGSGEGFGAIIDQDVVFDDLGIPYIPGKRLKGLLRDSYEEIYNLLNPGKACPPNILFGSPGQPESSPLFVSNFYPEDYENLKLALEILRSKHPEVFSPEAVLDAFTYIRQQTAIDDDGIAREHSLRTIRVLKKGLVFAGSIYLDEKSIDKYYAETVDILAISAANLKRFGTKRTRGFGEVFCYLKGSNNTNLSQNAINNILGEIK